MDGESNPDTGFSELACSSAQTVWSLVQQKYSLDTINMKATIPDMNLEFSEHGVLITKSIETMDDLQRLRDAVRPAEF